MNRSFLRVLKHKDTKASLSVSLLCAILDFFQILIWSLKLPFLASLLSNFSTICMLMLLKFAKKSAKKLSIFLSKAGFERSLLAFLCVCLVSCGYRYGIGNSLLTGKTISIPYVVGDLNGFLTAAIIKEVSSSMEIIYTNGVGDYTLKVEVLDFYEDNVGFHYDRKKHGELKKYIVPIETRATLITQVEVLDTSWCRVIGPINIKASIDFDHDYYSSRNGVNIFSLGQLSDIDSAEEAMRKPLNKAMAEKIADFLNNI